jgi:hypothetical protein
MTLLAPIMLAGAAAVTVPVALHFFYRARYRPLPWAPMKFLKEAIEQTSRRLKFQEWILLALRCLALILLALALARPGRDSTASGGGTQPIDAVLVFDTSYSMAAKDGDRTRLERAREAAVAIIDALPNKSSVQIIACSDRAQHLGPVSTNNRDQAKQIVQALELTSLSTDFLPGLTEALTAAETGTAPSKEIFLFTDLQKTGFERQQGAVKSKCEEIKSKAGLIFIRCGNPERKIANVAVTDVQLLAAIPHTKTRVPFKVTLKNTGREPIRGVKVSLELDGKAVEKDAVQVDQIDTGASATVTLTGALEDAGARLLAVRVEGDGLEGDNVLYKIIGVRDKVRVLLVAPPRRSDQNETEGSDWYARKALVPFDAEKDREKVERYFIETETVAPNEVGPDKLANKDIVYLLNAAARTDNPLEGFSPAFVTRLGEFVRNGGGLVIGCGDAVTAAAYNRVLGKDGAGLLPMPLGDVRNTTEAALFVPSAASIEETSVLGPIKPYTEWIEHAQLSRMFALDESPAASGGARVLMRTADNKPLVVSREVGSGEVIFFATALDESWGRMMSFGQLAVPLTTHIVAHLTARKVPGGTRMAGDALVWHPPKQESGFELIKPRPPADKPGEKTRPRVKLGEAKDVDGRLTVSTSDTLVAGEYAIVPVGAPDPVGLTGENGIAFVVNPDLRETENLDVLGDGEVGEVLGFRPTIIPAGAGTESAVRERRTRGEWTEYALLILLFLLIGEATWAWFCGTAR